MKIKIIGVLIQKVTELLKLILIWKKIILRKTGEIKFMDIQKCSRKVIKDICNMKKFLQSLMIIKYM